MEFRTAAGIIQQEVSGALGQVQDEQIEALLAVLLAAPRIFLVGAGRVGLATRAFAMRLMHLGLPAFFVGDTITPAIRPGDLLFVCSGSGETCSVVLVADLAAQQGADIVTITRNAQAYIGRQSKAVVEFMKESGHDLVASVQPMTTLFEQSLFLLLDALVLLLMERLGQREPQMCQRHTNLE